MKVLRQPLAPTSEPLIRADSWWEHASIVGFTARAGAEREWMVNDTVGRKAPDVIDGQWIMQVTKR